MKGKSIKEHHLTIRIIKEIFLSFALFVILKASFRKFKNNFTTMIRQHFYWTIFIRVKAPLQIASDSKYVIKPVRRRSGPSAPMTI